MGAWLRRGLRARSLYPCAHNFSMLSTQAGSMRLHLRLGAQGRGRRTPSQWSSAMRLRAELLETRGSTARSPRDCLTIGRKLVLAPYLAGHHVITDSVRMCTMVCDVVIGSALTAAKMRSKTSATFRRCRVHVKELAPDVDRFDCVAKPCPAT